MEQQQQKQVKRLFWTYVVKDVFIISRLLRLNTVQNDLESVRNFKTTL